jgi:streptogramin lyase
MRVLTCILASVPLVFGAAKLDNKKPDWPPKAGVKTPGIRIPMADLKAEAEIAIDAPVETFYVAADAAFLAGKTKSEILPIDLKANKAEAAIGGFNRPCATVVSAFGSVWVPNCGEAKIHRLAAKTKKITASVEVPVMSATHSVAATSDSVWVLSDDKTTLTRLDPDTNAIVAEVRLPAACNSVLFAEKDLWVTCPKDNKLLRINALTNLVEKRIDVPAQPIAAAAGESSIWVLSKTDGKITRIDPKTNKPTATIELGTPGLDGDLAFGEGYLWASQPGFPVVRIDPANDKVAQQFAGPGGGVLYVGAGSVWIPNLKPNTLSRFDPKRIKATLAD